MIFSPCDSEDMVQGVFGGPKLGWRCLCKCAVDPDLMILLPGSRLVVQPTYVFSGVGARRKAELWLRLWRGLKGCLGRAESQPRRG